MKHFLLLTCFVCSTGLFALEQDFEPYRRGKNYVKSGEYDKAFVEFNRFIGRTPDDFDKLKRIADTGRKAYNFYHAGKIHWKDAKKYFIEVRRLRALFPMRPDTIIGNKIDRIDKFLNPPQLPLQPVQTQDNEHYPTNNDAEPRENNNTTIKVSTNGGVGIGKVIGDVKIVLPSPASTEPSQNGNIKTDVGDTRTDTLPPDTPVVIPQQPRSAPNVWRNIMYAGGGASIATGAGCLIIAWVNHRQANTTQDSDNANSLRSSRDNLMILGSGLAVVGGVAIYLAPRVFGREKSDRAYVIPHFSPQNSGLLLVVNF